MLISLIRAVILYLVLILVVRLMGKRQLGEMEPMEFVVTMLIANLAAVPMQPAMDLSRDKNAEEMKWSPLEMGAAMQAHGA